MIRVGLSAGRGRGIFATEDIKPSTLIISDPVVEIPVDEEADINKTILANYSFMWFDTTQTKWTSCIVLGLGSLINHDKKPNIQWTPNPTTRCMEFWSVKPIKAGEELFNNYGYDPKEDQRTK